MSTRRLTTTPTRKLAASAPSNCSFCPCRAMLPVALNFVARRFSRRCPWFFKPLPMVFSSVGYGLDWMSPYKAVNKKERVCKRNTSSLFVRLKGLEPLRREAPDPKSGVATNYTTAAFGFSLTSAKVRKKSEIPNRGRRTHAEIHHSRSSSCLARSISVSSPRSLSASERDTAISGSMPNSVD